MKHSHIFSLILIFTFLFQIASQAQQFNTIRDGDWNDPSTWANGIIPIISQQNPIGPNVQVLVTHHLTLTHSHLTIDGNSNTKVEIDNGSLNAGVQSSKKLTILNGTFKAINSNVVLDKIESHDKLELLNSNLTIANGTFTLEPALLSSVSQCISTNSSIEVSSGNYRNNSANNTMNTTCFKIMNGNYGIKDGLASFTDVCLYIPQGNMKLEGTASINGNFSALHVNGTVMKQNASLWNATVQNYYFGGNNTAIPNGNLGTAQTTSWMTNYFNTCSCMSSTGGNGTPQARITAQSGFWDDPNTWQGGIVPTIADPTTIKYGTSVTIRNNTDVIMDDVIVDAGASISSTSSERLVIMDRLKNDGTIGRLMVTGLTKTIAKIGEVGDLLIDLDNSSDILTVTNRTTIKKYLKIERGGLDSDLEFLSSSGGTAIFDESGSGSITGGTAYINTKLDMGKQGWRYWCPSVRDNSTWTVGGFPLQSANGTTLVYRYIESNAIYDVSGGWTAQGMAYLHPLAFSIYIGDHPDGPSGATYTITANGDLQTGSQSLTHLMSYTGNATTDPTRDPRGWTMLGNPFQSSLDWDAISNDPAVTNIEKTYYLWDPYFKDYESYNATTGVGTGGLDQYIRPHHGVFIKQTGPGATLVLDNTHKDFTQRTSGMNRVNTSTNVPTLELSMNSSTRRSSIVLRFDNGTLDFDPQLDNRNMLGDGADLIEFSSNNGLNSVDLQVNTVAALGSDPYIIPLSNEVVQFENLTINLDNSVNMPIGSAVYLYDKVLAIQHDICQGAYSFTTDQNDVNDRFELRVVPQASVNVETIEDNNIKMYAANNQIMLELDEPLYEATTLQVINLTGQVVSNILLPAGQSNYALKCAQLLENNVYILSLPQMDISNKIKW